jgi:hypothetical protein
MTTSHAQIRAEWVSTPQRRRRASSPAQKTCATVFQRSFTVLWRSFTPPIQSPMKRYAALRSVNCRFYYTQLTQLHGYGLERLLNFVSFVRFCSTPLYLRTRPSVSVTSCSTPSPRPQLPAPLGLRASTPVRLSLGGGGFFHYVPGNSSFSSTPSFLTSSGAFPRHLCLPRRLGGVLPNRVASLTFRDVARCSAMSHHVALFSLYAETTDCFHVPEAAPLRFLRCLMFNSESCAAGGASGGGRQGRKRARQSGLVGHFLNRSRRLFFGEPWVWSLWNSQQRQSF